MKGGEGQGARGRRAQATRNQAANAKSNRPYSTCARRLRHPISTASGAVLKASFSAQGQEGSGTSIAGIESAAVSHDHLTGKREHEGPGPVPRVCVISLLAPVHVHAQPGGRDGRAPQLLLAELGESLHDIREPLGSEVVFGRCPHLHAYCTEVAGATQGRECQDSACETPATMWSTQPYSFSYVDMARNLQAAGDAYIVEDPPNYVKASNVAPPLGNGNALRLNNSTEATRHPTAKACPYPQDRWNPPESLPVSCRQWARHDLVRIAAQ